MKPWGHVHEWGPTTRRHKGQRVYTCTTCPATTTSNRDGGPKDDCYPWGLTRREWELLRHLAQGRSRPWIAHHMRVKTTTINVYLWRIREKIGVDASVGRSDTSTVVFAYHCYINRNRSRGWRT